MLSEVATAAHTQIQKNCEHINPVVGINRGMRAQGIPADAMTIDCLVTGKRIILILHDQNVDVVLYQLSYKDQDPSDSFESIQLSELTSSKLYAWIKDYFTVTP
tara:strand:- start:187 stop:498 length:312 start_codon:yes stop_codon:yes gene_type:complete